MTVIATRNKTVLSSVLMDDVAGLVMDYNIAHGQTAQEASDTEYTLGQVVIWDTDHWEALATTDVLTGGSTADTANHPLAVVVGFDSLGDTSTGTVGTGGTDVVLLYQGPANIKEAGLVLDAGLTGGEVTAAKAQLASQGLKLKAVSTQVDVSYYSA